MPAIPRGEVSDRDLQAIADYLDATAGGAQMSGDSDSIVASSSKGFVGHATAGAFVLTAKGQSAFAALR